MTRLPAATLLGQNVQRLCEMQGMGLDVLAERLAWSDNTLADLKAGSLDIALDQLDRLCAALDATPGELLREVTIAQDQTLGRRYG